MANFLHFFLQVSKLFIYIQPSVCSGGGKTVSGPEEKEKNGKNREKQMKSGENKIKRKQEKIEKRKKIGNDREKNVEVKKGMEGIIRVLAYIKYIVGHKFKLVLLYINSWTYDLKIS